MYGLSVGSIRANIVLNTSGWNASSNKVLGDVKRLNQSISVLGRTLLSVGMGITGLGAIAVREFAKFDKAMHDATAVSDVTEKQFKQMAQEAEAASIRWNMAAADTAKAFLYLGRAGLTATEQMAAFNPIVTGSKAMMADLEKTTIGVVNVVRAFKLEFGDTERVVNVVTQAVNDSTQDLEDMLAAMSYAGKPAHAMNNSIEDLSAMLQVMADSGVRGSKAGTALRFSLTHLARPTTDMRRLMLNLGLQIHDSEGKMKPFINIIKELRYKLSGATEEQRDYALATLFGTRALTGILALYEAEDGQLEKIRDGYANVGNAAEKVAEKQMKSLSERFGQVRQEANALKRDIAESLEPAFMSWFDKLEERFKRIREWIGGHKEETAQIVKNLAKLALVSVAVGALLVVVPMITNAFGALTSVILNPFMLVIAGLYMVRVAWKKDILGIKTDMKAWWETMTGGTYAEKTTSFLGAGLGAAAGLLALKTLLAMGGGAMTGGMGLLIAALLLGGASNHGQIADQLGVSRPTIVRDVQVIEAQWREDAAKDLGIVRGQDLKRIDRLIAGLWPQAVKGHLGAVDRVVKLLDRHAKLLGLDAPAKLEHTGENGDPLKIIIERVTREVGE